MTTTNKERNTTTTTPKVIILVHRMGAQFLIQFVLGKFNLHDRWMVEASGFDHAPKPMNFLKIRKNRVEGVLTRFPPTIKSSKIQETTYNYRITSST